jgi:hypothetical protein
MAAPDQGFRCLLALIHLDMALEVLYQNKPVLTALQHMLEM